MRPVNKDGVPLTVEQETRINALSSKAALLLYASPESLDKLDAFIEGEMRRVQDTLDPDARTPAAAAIAANVATGPKPDFTAAVALRMEGDRRVLAGIPQEKLKILRTVYGANDEKIAGAWRHWLATEGRPRA